MTGGTRVTSFTDPAAAVREFARRQHDLATLSDSPPPAPVDTSSSYVDLSRTSPGYAAALSLRNQGRTVTPLDDAGRPVPWSGHAFEFWSQHPSLAAGALCGHAQALLVASFSPAAWEWLKESATTLPPTREERVTRRMVEVADAGPDPDWDVSSPVEQGPHTLDPSGSPVMVTEMLPPTRPVVTGVTVGERAARNAIDSLTPPAPRIWRWLAWAGPADPARWADLPIGDTTRDGITLEAALPAEGTVLVRHGVRWRVANAPGLSLPPLPDWLADVLTGQH